MKSFNIKFLYPPIPDDLVNAGPALCISPEEIIKAISSMKNLKVPGLDNPVDTRKLKKLCDIAVDWLTNLFNAMVVCDCVPAWLGHEY